MKVSVEKEMVYCKNEDCVHGKTICCVSCELKSICAYVCVSCESSKESFDCKYQFTAKES